jgi:uncharacterized protein (DUF736 family)
MTVSIKLETAYSLAIQYKELALKQNPKILKMANPGELYSSNIILLLLNACIVEGVLRTWLTEQIKTDLFTLGAERTRSGKTSPSKPEVVAENYWVQVEHAGGWQKIIDQYREYMAVHLSKLDGYVATNHLFTLRNVIGHGTSIVIPKYHTNDPGSDYTDRWQKKLEESRKYLQSKLNSDDVLDALNKGEISKHFFDQSMRLLSNASGIFSDAVIQSSRAYKMLGDYSFGFR